MRINFKLTNMKLELNIYERSKNMLKPLPIISKTADMEKKG